MVPRHKISLLDSDVTLLLCLLGLFCLGLVAYLVFDQFMARRRAQRYEARRRGRERG